MAVSRASNEFDLPPPSTSTQKPRWRPIASSFLDDDAMEDAPSTSVTSGERKVEGASSAVYDVQQKELQVNQQQVMDQQQHISPKEDAPRQLFPLPPPRPSSHSPPHGPHAQLALPIASPLLTQFGGPAPQPPRSRPQPPKHLLMNAVPRQPKIESYPFLPMSTAMDLDGEKATEIEPFEMTMKGSLGSIYHGGESIVGSASPAPELQSGLGLVQEQARASSWVENELVQQAQQAASAPEFGSEGSSPFFSEDRTDEQGDELAGSDEEYVEESDTEAYKVPGPIIAARGSGWPRFTTTTAQLTQPGLPQPGSQWNTLELLVSTCDEASAPVIGVHMYHDNRKKLSPNSRVAMIKCGLGSDWYKVSHGGKCPHRIIACRENPSSPWIVDGLKSVYEHNHPPHPNLVADPTWRPRAKTTWTRKASKSKASSDQAASSERGTPSVPPSSPPAQLSPSQIAPQQTRFSIPAMPQVGDTFDSRQAMHTAGLRAAYDSGFSFIITKSLKESSQVMEFGCNKGATTIPLEERCPFRMVVSVTKSKGAEEWKVTSLRNKHTHPATPADQMRPWKDPVVRTRKRGTNKTSKKRKVEESDEEDDYWSDEDDVPLAQLTSRGKRTRSTGTGSSSSTQSPRRNEPVTSTYAAPHPRPAFVASSSSSSTLRTAPTPHPFLDTLASFLTALVPTSTTLVDKAPQLIKLGFTCIETLVTLLQFSESNFDLMFSGPELNMMEKMILKKALRDVRASMEVKWKARAAVTMDPVAATVEVDEGSDEEMV